MESSTIPYVVKPGECMASIGAAFKCDWVMLWELPENVELRERRKDPHVLSAGDVVRVPRAAVGVRPAQGRSHTFKLARSTIRVRLQSQSKALSGEPFVAEPWIPQSGPLTGYYGKGTEGKTDSEGLAEFTVPSSVRRVRLTVGKADSALVYDLAIGMLDPADTPNGFRQRLGNLGAPCPAVDSPDFSRAVSTFQARYGLEVTGEVDDPTVEQVRSLYGC